MIDMLFASYVILLLVGVPLSAFVIASAANVAELRHPPLKETL